MPLPASLPPDSSERRYGRMSATAAGVLRELIVSGQLLPDEPLQIDEIADLLGISTTPVREALLTLKAEGFVDSVRRQGFRVHPTTPEDIRDVFFVHAEVSGELAARAVAIISDDQIRELQSLHHEMIAASLREDMSALERLNYAFHRTLHLVVDAPALHRIVGQCAKYVPRHLYASIGGWPEATTSEHTAIIEAVQARDADAARRATREHLMHSGELLADHFRRATQGESAAQEQAAAPQPRAAEPSALTGPSAPTT